MGLAEVGQGTTSFGGSKNDDDGGASTPSGGAPAASPATPVASDLPRRSMKAGESPAPSGRPLSLCSILFGADGAGRHGVDRVALQRDASFSRHRPNRPAPPPRLRPTRPGRPLGCTGGVWGRLVVALWTTDSRGS